MVNLKDLQILTEELSEFVREKSEGHITYMVDGGECTGVSLKNNELIAIQDARMTKGTIFPGHRHEENEFIIQYDGEAVIDLGGNEIKLTPGEAVHIHPNESHTYKALTDVKLIGITIPRSDSYPNGDNCG